MSRIGKKPVEIPAKTKVEVKGQAIYVEGPKGKLEWIVPSPIKVEVKDGRADIVLGKAETAWLEACWKAATATG